jgi:hypothetical protein
MVKSGERASPSRSSELCGQPDLGAIFRRGQRLVRISICEPLALGTNEREIGAGYVIHPQLDTIAVTEIELGEITVQVSLAAMLIDAFHAAFKDAVKAFNSVGMNFAANIFIGLMADALMAREVIAQMNREAA